MNKNKLALSTKFLVFALSAVILLMAVIGVSNIFADPTIFDLVEEQDIGTFKPSRLYDAETDTAKFYAWLSVNKITVEYDMWKDTNENGEVEVEDVYSVEGFEHHMLMDSQQYSMLLLDEKDNFVVVPLYDYKGYNSVLVELFIGPNAEIGETYKNDCFYYDSETKILYIDRELIRESVEEQNMFTTIRAEAISLVESIDDYTREITIATIFNSDIENTHGLLKNTPNGKYAFNVKEWNTSGLIFQLVDQDRLAYVSKDDLSVYVNHIEFDAWSYDETSGQMLVNCLPGATDIVIVKFNDVIDADALSQTLQASAAPGQIAQAASFKDSKVISGDNPFLKKLYFEQEKPQPGATTAMEFLYFTWNENGTIKSMQQSGACNVPLVDTVTREFMQKATKVDGYYQTATISAFQTDPNYDFFTDNYGMVVYNVWLYSDSGDTDALSKALHWSIKKMGGIPEEDNETHIVHSGYQYPFTDTWRVNYWSDGKMTDFVGRYVAGMNIADANNPFLGGILKDDSGYAFFDVSCAKITAPESMSTTAWNNFHNANYTSGVNHWDSKATIVEIDEENGYLYICLWARALDANGDPYHTQRVLAFSRVPYEFNGKGTFTIVKKDADTQVNVAGAKFEIYDNPNCNGTPVLELTSELDPIQSPEINSGTYYIKEVEAPAGYVPSSTIQEVTITGGQNVAVIIENRRQQVTVNMHVLDRTTEGSGHEVGVAGVKFVLKSPNTAIYPDKNCISDSNGRLTFEDGSDIVIPAIGNYILNQVDTVKYYAYDDVNSGIPHYYCKEILVAAEAKTKDQTDFGKDYTITLKHYEQRQTVKILSHVQDINIGAESGTQLGGVGFDDYVNGEIKQTAGSTVSLIGAKYQLFAPRAAEEPLFLGYKNGQKVTISNPNEPLQFVARAANGSKQSDKITYSNAIITGVDKAFIEVTHIVVGGVEYPAPNGVYEWRLYEPSAGYYLDDDSESEANQNANATIAAEWKMKDDSGGYLVVYERNDVPVKMVRQTIDMKVWSKTFSESNALSYVRVTNQAYAARNNAIHQGHGPKWTSDELSIPMLDWNAPKIDVDIGHGVIRPVKKPTVVDPEVDVEGIVDDIVAAVAQATVERDVYSNSTTLTATSLDSIVITTTQKLDGKNSAQGNEYEVESDGLAVKTVYAIKNTVDVVDIQTGQVIPRNSVVGYYLARYNDNGQLVEGYFVADDWGSARFDNPNENGSPAVFPNYTALTGSNSIAGGGLPNGKYEIVPVYVENDCVEVPYISQDVTFGLGWDESTSDVAKKHYETVVMVYRDDIEPFDPSLPIAPDPDPEDIDPDSPDLPEDYPDYPYSPDRPYDPTDPYDPEFPDDPTDPDDSKDIPLVPYNWVLDNKERLTYRIIDSDNVTTADGVSTNDVVDRTTTTFSFFVNPKEVPVNKDKYTYTYTTWFYYEIPKTEYDAHDAVCTRCTYGDPNNDCERYAFRGGLCYRRFNVVGEYQGGDELSEVIVLNENSFGYQNLTSVMTEYATVSGAIYNYNWLNEKLAKEADGTYTIMIRLKTTESWVGVGNMICSRERADNVWGRLIIKNRQLFPLD